MVLSRNKIKYLNSFALKKNRDAECVFIAEGIKLVNDLLPYFKARVIVATKEWLLLNEPIAEEIIQIEDISEMKKISLLSTPTSVFCLFYQPNYRFDLEFLLKEKSLILALDSVQDPGNMGTIIRIADWFGIKNVICSKSTVDVYNSKTVQATMGALARVRIHYVDLLAVLNECKKFDFPIYGTFLNGESIYKANLDSFGIIVMGNEGKGISSDISECISKRLLIPNYPRGEETSESLNVAVATAIVCSEFRRR